MQGKDFLSGLIRTLPNTLRDIRWDRLARSDTVGCTLRILQSLRLLVRSCDFCSLHARHFRCLAE
jgi:hypothetical protein